MEQDETKRLILAAVLVMGIMFLAQVFLWEPQNRAAREEFEARQAAEVAAEASANPEVEPSTAEIIRSGETVERGDALQLGQRVPFEGDAVDGSILLQGARLDDLRLKRHFETLKDRDEANREGEIAVLSPQGSEEAFYAAIGWMGEGDGSVLVNALTDWKITSGTSIAPGSPVTLFFEGDGFSVERKIEVDENYLFSYEDTVTNTSGAARILKPYGMLRQFGLPEGLSNFYILHEGLVGVMDDKLLLKKYNKLADGETLEATTNEGGWIGLTDKYWMGALIPNQAEPFSVDYRLIPRTDGPNVLQARFVGAERTLQAGESVTTTNHVFAGAKRYRILKAYEEELGVPRLNDAIDWGTMFFWLTKPFFQVLLWVNGYVGNFGVSILILTVLVRAVFFPIQNKAYESMTRMKKLQEPMQEIRERYKDDKQKQQQEVMALFQKEKVNPMAGCLPILIQIPVFYALYKTLFVTLEMRHEPFFGWIRDLSAPDPTAIGNLFGLLPWSAESVASIPLLGFVLGVGVLPILYGVTMWMVQSLSPPPPDETQRMIFGFLPIIFTFVFAGFAAGLVVYWTWSNILSIAQQYVIMRRNGVDTQFDKFLAKHFGKGNAQA